MRAPTGSTRPAYILGTLALIVDDELLAAFASSTPGGPHPAGVLDGTADLQHGNAAATVGSGREVPPGLPAGATHRDKPGGASHRPVTGHTQQAETPLADVPANG